MDFVEADAIPTQLTADEFSARLAKMNTVNFKIAAMHIL